MFHVALLLMKYQRLSRAEPEHNLCEHAWILLFSRDQGLCYLEQIYSTRHDILNRLVPGQAGDIERECLPAAAWQTIF